ncbi:MAG: hypothetical protein WBA10_10425 [Elainellaceae cyanobacterium]
MTFEAYGRIGFPETLSENPDVLMLIAVGSLEAVEACRYRLHQLGYAEVREWTDPMPAATEGKVMRVLTKYTSP